MMMRKKSVSLKQKMQDQIHTFTHFNTNLLNTGGTRECSGRKLMYSRSGMISILLGTPLHHNLWADPANDDVDLGKNTHQPMCESTASKVLQIPNRVPKSGQHEPSSRNLIQKSHVQ